MFNHPDPNPTPTPHQDVLLKLKYQGCRLRGLTVLRHRLSERLERLESNLPHSSSSSAFYDESPDIGRAVTTPMGQGVVEKVGLAVGVRVRSKE